MSKPHTNAAKGRRYTPKEQSEVLAFVDKVNMEQGRGGQRAACEKFKVSPLTVGAWLRKRTLLGGGPNKSDTKTGAPISRNLDRLQRLYGDILKKEKELAGMKQRFNVLKRSL